MIKTRLMGLLSHAKKYIAYTILWQWAALLSQVLAVFSIADLLEQVAYRGVTVPIIERTILILFLVLVIRFVCERMGARSSYLACVDVKRILREKIYEKMLKLGASYSEQVSSSEVVQVSTEGVEQLETYFGKYLPQLFYSLIAPLTLFIILCRVSLKASVILLICVPLIPISIVVVAIALFMVMMMFVLPAFKEVYEGMGAELPGLTQIMMAVSDFFVQWGWLMIIVMIGGVVAFIKMHAKSPKLQRRVDAWLLRAPIFGAIVRKATIARWARTTSSLFAAGVPLVEALDSVAGASGNILYEEATHDIRAKVNQGLSLTSSMQSTELFPNMVLQMTSIGEESGSLDDMLNKAAEFYEDEVDNAVAQLSSLMEPVIMVVLGSIIGVILVAMYLPLFNLGNVVG